MRRAAATLLVGLVACAPALRLAVDPTLSDGATVALRDPFVVLDEAATRPEPGTRRRALSALLRALPADRLVRWAAQGSYDPDPWVQGGVVEALLERAGEPGVASLLVDIATRGSADPYARARAAHGLLDRGLRGGLDPLRTAWVDKPGWKAAPLALVAARLGEPAARTVLERALRQGDVRDEPAFVVALGLHGWPELAPALARDAWAEEDLGLRLDVARALLGDAGGARGWRASLRARDAAEAREALELVLLLPEGDARLRWLGVARGARDPGVRRIAMAWLRPATLTRALQAADPGVREAVLPLVSEHPDREALLATALEDEDPGVREAAAALATRWRLPGLRPLLERVAGDDRVQVRLAAYGALLALDGPGPTPR